MKKTAFILGAISLPCIAKTQQQALPPIDKEIFNICSAIFVTALFMAFIVTLIRLFLNHRIRTKLMENIVPESIMVNLLKEESGDSKLSAAKWAIIFAGLGLAFSIIFQTLPLGIHSLGILFFCLSASFAAYYFFLSKKKG